MKNIASYIKCFRLALSIFLALTIVLQNLLAVEIVSLGGACLVARAARYNNLRNVAYPFDWMITSTHALTKAFQDDFKQVLVSEQTHEREDNKAVIDGYGLIFIHDFPTVRNPVAPTDGEIMPVHALVPNWRDSIDIVRAKFDRRLDRLLTLLRDGEPVALVRYEMNHDEAEQFITLLKQKFPYAKAVLVVIGSTSEFQQPWNVPHVRNLYIDEKDFRAWDGQAWSDAMFKIAAMNPQGWETDVLMPNNYLLTVPLYNPGLFSVFNTVLGALDWYDRGYISGLTIDFKNEGWYYDSTLGANWWNYYFEPVQLGDSGSSIDQKLFPTYQKIIFAYQSQYEMPRERAQELIRKYIHIKPHIIQQIDEFRHKNFDQHVVIGVHYRGTDKLTEVSPISHQDVVARIQSVLVQHVDKSVKIFVATDDASFCTYIKDQFPDLIIMRDALRSGGTRGVHTRIDLAPYQKGEDAIIDCLLLSHCDVLIKMASNLSDCSLQFNPQVPVIRLNTSYSE